MITFSFSGRHAIVTGGTRGIGAAVTRKLIEAGASVTAVYAGNTEKAQAFKETFTEDQLRRLDIRKLNVADDHDCDELFAEYADTPLDILVNSAGIRRDAVTAMMQSKDWQDVIDVNLTGTFNTFKRAVKAMMPHRYGRIIALTSPSGRIGIQGQANYAASKAGIVALTKSCAREIGRRGITVNAVSPGFIDTDFISELPDEQRAAYKDSVPMKRFGRAEEVADAILFLASEEAAYITGSVLEISGGL